MRKVFTALLCAAPLSLWASDGPPPCAKFSSAQDVVSCALQNHPEVVRLQMQASNLGALDLLAGQRPNPEFEAETLHPSEDDRASLEVEVSYLHTFETGRKRRRRLDRAQAQKELILAQLERAREEVKLQTLLHLYRLRQIQQELHITEEASATFGKIIGQHRSRAQLSPEQEVGLNVFTLAQGDYRLRKSSLLQERRTLRQFFEVATGADFQTILDVLPAPLTEWPSLPSLGSGRGGAARREAQAEVAISQAELSLAASEAAPDIGLGPRMASESGNGQSSQSFGAALSMALPLYNRNRGGRAVAEFELRRAQAILALREKEFEKAFEAWSEIYQEAVDALQNTPSPDQSEKKHRDVERQFHRGLISASLVIEAHRQITDFTASRNEQELRATEALWTLRALQGRIFQEKP